VRKNTDDLPSLPAESTYTPEHFVPNMSEMLTDHCHLVGVTDTDRALESYRGLLGMNVVLDNGSLASP
jgi:hypothetical protein